MAGMGTNVPKLAGVGLQPFSGLGGETGPASGTQVFPLLLDVSKCACKCAAKRPRLKTRQNREGRRQIPETMLYGPPFGRASAAVRLSS